MKSHSDHAGLYLLKDLAHTAYFSLGFDLLSIWKIRRNIEGVGELTISIQNLQLFLYFTLNYQGYI